MAGMSPNTFYCEYCDRICALSEMGECEYRDCRERVCVDCIVKTPLGLYDACPLHVEDLESEEAETLRLNNEDALYDTAMDRRVA